VKLSLLGRTHADTLPADFDDVARRKYKKDIDTLKPDLKSYNAQRAAALGYDTADAMTAGGSSSAEVAKASEMLYRDANSFVYADHTPSEDAIDKVIHKMNAEWVVPLSQPIRANSGPAYTSGILTAGSGRRPTTPSLTSMRRTRCACACLCKDVIHGS
jgi:hypothetical protein